MSTAATLTVIDRDPLHRTYTLDCQHAATTSDWLMPRAGGVVDEAVILGMLQE